MYMGILCISTYLSFKEIGLQEGRSYALLFVAGESLFRMFCKFLLAQAILPEVQLPS